jgi:hypothetical protein
MSHAIATRVGLPAGMMREDSNSIFHLKSPMMMANGWLDGNAEYMDPSLWSCILWQLEHMTISTHGDLPHVFKIQHPIRLSEEGVECDMSGFSFQVESEGAKCGGGRSHGDPKGSLSGWRSFSRTGGVRGVSAGGSPVWALYACHL